MSETKELTFVDQLVEMIALIEPVAGAINLKHRLLHDLIYAKKSRIGLFPVFTDDELSQMVSDSRIDWPVSYVSSQDPSDKVTLLAHFIYCMEMSEYLTWMPLTTKALNERYTPAEQVVILKQCEAMPGGNGSFIDGRHLLAGRIVPLILQNDQHLDAWVDAWFEGIKEREGRFTCFPVFSTVHKVTKAYKTLEKSDGRLCRIPILLTLAGALDQESVMKSVSRYTSASLYDITNGEFTGHLTMATRGDFSRKNLSYGLFLLLGPESELLTRSLLDGVLKDNHFELCSSILAVSVNFTSNFLPIEKLINTIDPITQQTALDNVLQEHSFSWVNDWFQRLNSNPTCIELKEAVLNVDRFKTWCTDYAKNNTLFQGSVSTLKKLTSWVSMLSQDDQSLCLDFLISKFETDIDSRKKHGKAILFAKILVTVFPENDRTKYTLANRLNSLIMKSISIKDRELVPEMVKIGMVDLSEIGAKIKSEEAFHIVTGQGGLDRESLLPYLKHTIRGSFFSQELGI